MRIRQVSCTPWYIFYCYCSTKEILVDQKPIDQSTKWVSLKPITSFIWRRNLLPTKLYRPSSRVVLDWISARWYSSDRWYAILPLLYEFAMWKDESGDISETKCNNRKGKTWKKTGTLSVPRQCLCDGGVSHWPRAAFGTLAHTSHLPAPLTMWVDKFTLLS